MTNKGNKEKGMRKVGRAVLFFSVFCFLFPDNK